MKYENDPLLPLLQKEMQSRIQHFRVFRVVLHTVHCKKKGVLRNLKRFFRCTRGKNLLRFCIWMVSYKTFYGRGPKWFRTKGFVQTPRETRVSYRTPKRTSSERVSYKGLRTGTSSDDGSVIIYYPVWGEWDENALQTREPVRKIDGNLRTRCTPTDEHVQNYLFTTCSVVPYGILRNSEPCCEWIVLNMFVCWRTTRS